MVLGLSLVAIALAAFVLTRSEPEVEPPAAPKPVVTAQPNPVVVTPIPSTAPMPKAEDAGVAVVAPHDVVFHVTRSGATAVGTRIDLQAADGGVIGGTVNTFGTLTLPLEPGLWTVRPPVRTEPGTVLIAPDTVSAELIVLAERIVSGTVVDRAGNPVSFALVSAHSPGKAWKTMSAADGTFTLTTPTDDVLEVFAERESSRSRQHFFRAPQSVTLKLEPTFSYDISATGPLAKTVRLVVRHGFGFNTCIGLCRVTVPEGEVTASGVSFNGTAVFSARVVERVSANTVRQLKLEPAPPLTGRLLDAKGTPIPGAQLRLNRFNMSNQDYLGDAMPKAMGFDNTVLTDSHGAFTVAFPAENFPIWILTADAPYVLDRRVLVVPGDEPLELRAK